MTKQEEIAALRTFIAALPTTTYLRPWLESVEPEIKRELRCDMYPEHTPASWAESVRKQAQDEAQRITDAAHREAAAILEKARMKEDEVAQKRLRLYRDLKKIMGELY